VSLHRLLTAVWTQHPGTTESGDSGVDNTSGHYKLVAAVGQQQWSLQYICEYIPTYIRMHIMYIFMKLRLKALYIMEYILKIMV